MSSPVNTVSVDGWDISGHDESAADMMEGLQGPDTEEGGPEPRVKVDRGKAVEQDEPDPLSKAASELGKKGGEAAAKAKAKAAREAKKEADDEGAEESRKAVPDAKAEVDEPDGSEVAEEAKPKLGHPSKDPNARVMQAVKRAKEAEERAARVEREASEYRYRLERLEREKAAPANVTQSTVQSENPEPQEGDFENYSDYVKALARHEYTKAAREDQQKAQIHYQAAAHVQRVTQIADALKAALNKAAQADPQFRENIAPEVMNLGPSFMLEPGQQPGPHNWIADELLSAPDNAPGLMLYLSEHPDEFQRLVALSSPRAITRELTRISVRLDAATAGTSAERRVSKAKPPVTPVTGSPNTADEDPSDEDDYDTHVRKMNAKERRARR